MLWLAGLMGVAGVGAAAFVGIKTDVAEEEDTLQDEQDQMSDLGDLLTQIQDHSGSNGLLQTQPHLNLASAAAEPAAIGGWGDDVLNEIMAEFEVEDAAPVEVDGAPEPGLIYSSALLDADDVDLDAEAGADDILLSDWIDQRHGSEILDYEARTESLMLVWDDTTEGAAEPQVGVAPAPDDPEVMQVSMNGENVAEVYGDSELSVADLTLIPLSSAMVIGLEAL